MRKMAAPLVEHGEDAFRKLFKFYKRRNPPPDLKDVVDFSRPLRSDKVHPSFLEQTAVSDEHAKKLGLKPVCDWRAFGLTAYPGFIFISNPFLPSSQSYWLKQCLKAYPQKPNVCNLDMHMAPTETEDIWGQSAEALRKKGCGKRDPKTLLEKLRWVTLGYHYNWDTKKYSANHHTPFPADLHSVSRHIAAACGFPGFDSQAGILNYYRSDSSLGIHVDESELDHTRPLLSFSFGQSAVFLLGGTRREDPPTAMFMHSGDVMVMSGSSRLLYHAVPCIVPAPEGDPLHPVLQREGLGPDQGLNQEESTPLGRVSEEEWEVCSKYIQHSRVNMTVRQVLGPGQSFPRTDTAEQTMEMELQTDGYQEQLLDGENVGTKRRRSEEDTT